MWVDESSQVGGEEWSVEMHEHCAVVRVKEAEGVR